MASIVNVIHTINKNSYLQNTSSPKATFEDLCTKKENEEWKERTEVVTKQDHVDNINMVQIIVNEMIETAVDKYVYLQIPFI